MPDGPDKPASSAKRSFAAPTGTRDLNNAADIRNQMATAIPALATLAAAVQPTIAGTMVEADMAVVEL